MSILQKKGRIALNFDLSQNELLKADKKPLRLYDKLTRFLKKEDFEKRGQSSFLSKDKIKMTEVFILVNELENKFDWFKDSVNKFTATFESDILDLSPYILDDDMDFEMENKSKKLVQKDKDKKQRALHFDLSVQQIDKYFSCRSTPYYHIKRVMTMHNFYHQQGSGYVSNEPITEVDVFDVVKDLKFRVPHFEDIVKSFDSTYLENVWNIKPFIDGDEEIATLYEEDKSLINTKKRNKYLTPANHRQKQSHQVFEMS